MDKINIFYRVEDTSTDSCQWVLAGTHPLRSCFINSRRYDLSWTTAPDEASEESLLLRDLSMVAVVGAVVAAAAVVVTPVIPPPFRHWTASFNLFV